MLKFQKCLTSCTFFNIYRSFIMDKNRSIHESTISYLYGKKLDESIWYSGNYSIAKIWSKMMGILRLMAYVSSTQLFLHEMVE